MTFREYRTTIDIRRCLCPLPSINLEMTKKKSRALESWVIGLLLPIAIALLGVTSFLYLGKQKPNQVGEDPSDPRVQLVKMPIASIDSVRPFEGLESLDISLSGTVVPFRQITLGSEIAGRVQFKSADCRIGRFVHPGDLLFRIDPKDYELEVERLSALRESEYAQQHELDQELANANRSLNLANEELALQEKELARIESLGSGFVSETEIAQTRRARIAVANQVVTVQNQLRLLETRRTRIELAERLAGAQLEQAKANLARTEIKSPIAGVIISETVQEDSFVQKGAPLCLIEDTERVEVSCNLTTGQLLMILDQVEDKLSGNASSRVLRSASYELPNTPVEISYRVTDREEVVYQWTGHLSRYEGLGLDAQSRTVPVRIMVDNPRGVRRNGQKIEEDDNGGLPALVRGMFVDVAIKTKPKRSLVLVPKLALRPGGQIWRFDSDPAMLVSRTASQEPVPAAESPNTESPKDDSIRLSDWEVGRVKILSGVNSISLVRIRDAGNPDAGNPEAGSVEFWVAEASESLVPGMRTIVSPLANIVGDGNDRVRISLSGNR
jgi:multidrug efflux pump subunit AcrA (membrane-fusion protein)